MVGVVNEACNHMLKGGACPQKRHSESFVIIEDSIDN